MLTEMSSAEQIEWHAIALCISLVGAQLFTLYNTVEVQSRQVHAIMMSPSCGTRCCMQPSRLISHFAFNNWMPIALFYLLHSTCLFDVCIQQSESDVCNQINFNAHDFGRPQTDLLKSMKTCFLNYETWFKQIRYFCFLFLKFFSLKSL